jgi:hypothetical protein
VEDQFSVTDPRVEALKRTLSPSEAAHAQECWGVLLMAIEQDVLLTFDMDDVLPPLPFNVQERQGYMIRQTLLDIAIQVDREKKGR